MSAGAAPPLRAEDADSAVLITGIGELVTNDSARGEGSPLGLMTDAALVTQASRVSWIGQRSDAPSCDEHRDLGGRAVVPGFVDSHTPGVRR